MNAPGTEMLSPGDEPALNPRAWLTRETDQFQMAPEVSLAEQVAARIEALARKHVAGERLGSKDELRERVGVSVGTLNEALRIAQARGVVTLRRGPGGGIFSAQATPLVRLGAEILGIEEGENTVQDALRMRNALDPLALSDAVEYVTARDISELRELLGELQRSLREGDVDSFIRDHWKFQMRVTSISPNALLRTVFQGLIDILEEHTVALAPPTSETAKGVTMQFRLHERMIEALESRDRDEVFQVMNDYIASQGSEADPVSL